MVWNRQKSNLENLMVEVLKKKSGLSLQEIVNEILKIEPSIFTGETPRNSLYSIIYRREKARMENGIESLFLSEKCRSEILFSLNPKNCEY